ncbi:MAG: glutamate mutase L [Planctomycetota bacterium]|jgi:uncharacterized protein (TIGR01319 family)
MARDDQEANSYLITDCGSTTTKALLIEKEGGRFRLTARGESPTTVEAPHEDVLLGVLNAVRGIEAGYGRRLLEQARLLKPAGNDGGVDRYLSTSSAGGGLQMLVAGVVQNLTGRSAARAALGAGAIVMDTLCANDERPDHEKIEAIRLLRPDMILLAGGVDGGTQSHILELSELLKAARPRARLGPDFPLPVVYGGNKDAAEKVKEILEDHASLFFVPNIRPILEEENLKPAREKIHDLFMKHVMAQVPGYRNLLSWVDAPIMPTPAAVGSLMQAHAEKTGISIMAVDIGGATTDIFSVYDGRFNRTVSANLGMSYSISNVLAEAGIERIERWLPFEPGRLDLKDRIGNKMIRPTTIPQTLEDLKVEQAVAREALRLAFQQHRDFTAESAVPSGDRTLSDLFKGGESREKRIDLMGIDLIIGSGGVLSHAARRVQAARMLIDALLPEGITELAVDSIFMMPHLGVLAATDREAAHEVFHSDCLLELGTCVAPRGPIRPGQRCMKAKLALSDGSAVIEEILHGDLMAVPLEAGSIAEARFEPAKGLDLGAGPGAPVECKVKGGEAGLILDGRGRDPFAWPAKDSKRIETLKNWSRSVGEFPD